MVISAALSLALRFALSAFAASAMQDPVELRPDATMFRIEGEEIVLGVQEGSKALTLLDLAREVGVLEGISFSLPERSDEDGLKKEHVRLLRELRVPKAKARELLESFLMQHSFAVIEQGEPPVRTVRIVRMQGQGLQALKSSLRVVREEELELYRGRSASLISTAMSLQHLSPQAATTMLSRFFSNAALEGFASLSDPGSRPALMLVGFGPTVCSIRDLIRSVDLPPRGNADTEELRFGIELWEVTDTALREELSGLVRPAEVEGRLRSLSVKPSSLSLRVSLVTGTSLRLPAPPSSPEGSKGSGRLELSAMRSDAERYQVDLALLEMSFATKAGEAETRETPLVSSSMLLKVGESRALMLSADAPRTLVVLVRLLP